MQQKTTTLKSDENEKDKLLKSPHFNTTHNYVILFLQFHTILYNTIPDNYVIFWNQIFKFFTISLYIHQQHLILWILLL